MANEKSIQKVNTIDAGKALAAGQRELREGEKPSAPANLVLPKPVAMPVAPNKPKSNK
jgi:hypothetical protein